MEIDVTGGPAESVTADTFAVVVSDPASEPPAWAKELNGLVASGEVSSARGKAALLHLGDRRVVAAGAGPRAEIDADALRDAAAGATRELQGTVGGSLAWLLDPSLLESTEQLGAVVEGVLLGGYDPGTWKTSPDGQRPLDRLVLVGDVSAAEARRAATVARWTNHARDLSNRPPNDLTPAVLADHAAELAGRLDHLTAEALDPDGMRAHNMGAILAVGQGSDNEPRMILMRHDPPTAQADIVLGLVGKGMTFDTGGISIKPRLYMEDMKGDMAGSAAVIAAVGAIAELELPLRVVAVIGSAENMPSGTSYRPGDIVTAMNGKTIEVTDTDAEGRIVLADALVYAREQGATHLLDLATLTGAMERALGDLYAGVFGSDAAWRDEVAAAGEAAGDHAWSLPMHPRYRRFIESAFADMKNHNVRNQGIPVYAAEFLREFAGDGPWAHIDMAGTGFLTWPRGDYISQKGGTGYGVRLIVELARRLCG
ncbi:MAG: leucyl aminopeptidase [Candidatus Rokuibacteriota bacterium]|nr:MAG: leucyl aminopeptidase [Candidatus Rokubacteria bacterium]